MKHNLKDKSVTAQKQPTFEPMFPPMHPGRKREVGGAVYKGPSPFLKGKTAIVHIHDDYVQAQFDDVSTGYAHGWHTFHLDDFEGLEDDDLAAEAPEDEPAPAGGPTEAQREAPGGTAGLIESINKAVDQSVYLMGDPGDENIEQPGLAISPHADPKFTVKEEDLNAQPELRQILEEARAFDLPTKTEKRPPGPYSWDKDGQFDLKIDPKDAHAFDRPVGMGEAPLQLPAPRPPLLILADSIERADRRLKQAIPIMVELRDLGRVFAWGLVAVGAAGVFWGLIYLFTR